MNRGTRNFLGVLALAAAWTFLLDDETRQALTGDKKPAAIDANARATP